MFQSDSAHGAGVVVLVVDDEPLIRMDAVDAVEGAGLRAIEASCADEAWKALSRDPNIAVLFTDVDMPGSMDGLKLAQKVSQHYPEVQIIVGSGRFAFSSKDLPSGALFFSKPYNMEKLAIALLSAAK